MNCFERLVWLNFSGTTSTMSRSFPQINSDKPLGGRYKVISQLGVGGFGRTFLAEDLHLPGHPQCVIKQLKPQFRSDDTLQMARRCFNTEAEVLYQLGNHDQIPRLLAHFEDNQEFYLAQEFIEGVSLTKELVEGKPWSEAQTVALLKDILRVLNFVHGQQVIHRDLKPSNLIRRHSDNKIVLIDFGAVKQVSTQNYDLETGITNLTISIGTHGYMPNEQIAGKPRFSSDIFAVGVLGVQALTGIHPRHLGEDEKGEISWYQRASHTSAALRDVIDRMVRYDFRDRYPTAIEALTALENLALVSDEIPPPFQLTLNAVEEPPPLDTPPKEELPEHQQLPGSEFSSVDMTLAGEEGLSTAIWERPEPPELSVLPVSPLNGSKTANGTGLTQAVGGTNPSSEMSQGSSVTTSTRKQWSYLGIRVLSGLGIVATAVIASIAVQTVGPKWVNPLIDPEAPPPVPSPTTSSSPSAPSLQSTNPTALFNYANQLMNEKAYQTALQFYDRAITLKSDYAEAYAGRCEALNQLGRPEDATVACNDALAYEPDSIEAMWSKGNALLLQDRTYEALKVYEDVTYFQPSFAPGWVKRGVALQQLGRSAEAIYVLEQAIALQRSSAEAWSTRGEALLNLQRYEEAIVSLDKALQLQNPDDPHTVELRQQVRQQLGR